MQVRSLLAAALLLSIAIVSAIPATPHALPSFSTPIVPTVTVFARGEEGYDCFKIPSLLSLDSGDLLAFSEGRRENCSDFAQTALVYKRSQDGGQTWGTISVLGEFPGHVIGNAAPVQERSTKKIVVPFCLDNRQVFVTASADDGYTWSTAQNITESVVRSHWPWVGTGPPSSLQLSSGRILTPSYHTYLIHEDGEYSHGHVMYSDDLGVTWQLGGDYQGDGTHPNENQAVELANGSVLVNARSLSFHRLQAVSSDGGLSFSVPAAVAIPEPASGCEMSTIRDQITSQLILSGPTVSGLYRTHLTLWVSASEGEEWEVAYLVDSGPSGYSSLAFIASLGSNGLLYERSKEKEVVMVPDEIAFLVLPNVTKASK